MTMENENTVQVEAPAVEKKTAPAKKTAKKETKAAVEEPKAAPKQKKVYDMHELVSVRNMTPGQLIYKSNRNIGYIVEWAAYNDEQPMEIMELKNMLASQRGFFERNWIWIDDPELLAELGVARYYKTMLSPDEVDALFALEADEMIAKVAALTKDMQTTILTVAKEKVAANEIKSYQMIQALQKYYDISFDEE